MKSKLLPALVLLVLAGLRAAIAVDVVPAASVGMSSARLAALTDRLQPFDGALATDHLRAPGGFSGGAQLISTADDFWRFAQMLLNGGEFDRVRYLAPKSVEMMTTDRLPVPAEVPYRGIGFGLNLAVVTRPAEVLYPVSEGGYFWSGLATTTFRVDPREALVVILLTQYLPWSDACFRDLMHRLVHAAILEPSVSGPIGNDP